MYSYSKFLAISDRYGISGDERLEQLANKLKYPLEDIVRAIREVGYDAEEIEEYIRDRYNRS